MIKPTPVSPSRWTAYSVLADWEEGVGFAEDLLETHSGKVYLSAVDTRLAQTLVYGVLRRLRLLDFWIDNLAERGLESLPPPVAWILRLSFYQSAFLERIPPHAITNEAVGLCEAVNVGGLKGLVNAMVRRLPENRERLDQALANHPGRLAIETSHPNGMVRWAQERFGPQKAESWPRMNNEEPRIYLRPVVSRLVPDHKDPLALETRRKGAEPLLSLLKVGEIAEDGCSVLLPSGSIPRNLGPFLEGLAMVQDLAAQQAVLLLAPKPGERILDLCCAPGGKTIQLADLSRGHAEILAVDSGAERLKRVRENLDRCGFGTVKTECRNLLTEWANPPWNADGVLLDVPCSGLGTLRRRVDLRYRIGPPDITELAEKAAQLLSNAAPLVRPGGRLVYSTCTLTSAENEDVIHKFVEDSAGEWELAEERYTPDFLMDSNASCPEKWPDSDASYCALLRKME